MLIVIKYLVFDKISPKFECGVDEYLCFPRVGTKQNKTKGKRVLEVFIQWYCLRGIPSMLCIGKVRKRYVLLRETSNAFIGAFLRFQNPFSSARIV